MRRSRAPSCSARSQRGGTGMIAHGSPWPLCSCAIAPDPLALATSSAAVGAVSRRRGDLRAAPAVVACDDECVDWHPRISLWTFSLNRSASSALSIGTHGVDADNGLRLWPECRSGATSASRARRRSESEEVVGVATRSLSGTLEQ